MKYILLLAATFTVNLAVGQDKRLRGTWDNEKGQILVFQEGNRALWIFYSEGKRDTFKIKYSADFKAKPYRLDLTDFALGPLKGRTLYGIIEYPDEKTMKFDCEPGKDESVRPVIFNPQQTQTYMKRGR